MHSPTLRLFACCAAVAAFLWCCFLLTREPDPVTGQLNPPPGRPSLPPARTAARAASVPDGTDWPPLRTSTEFRDRLREPAERWLASRGRDAAGLVAMWDLTWDDELLTEAVSRFPDDPRVLRAMIELQIRTEKDAHPWIEKLIAADPKNPDGHYLKAWALFAAGDHDAGLAALRGATAIGLPRESHTEARINTLTEAATACGLPPGQIARAHFEFLRHQDLRRRYYETARPAITALMEQASAAGDTAAVSGIGRSALAAHLNQRGTSDLPASLSDDVAGNRYLRAILSRLPDDWAWQPGGYTAAEWKDYAAKECGDLSRAGRLSREASDRLQHTTSEVYLEYWRLYAFEGDTKAAAWLMAQPAPAPPPPPPASQ